MNNINGPTPRPAISCALCGKAVLHLHVADWHHVCCDEVLLLRGQLWKGVAIKWLRQDDITRVVVGAEYRPEAKRGDILRELRAAQYLSPQICALLVCQSLAGEA